MKNRKRRCAYCNGPLPSDNPRAIYCKKSCRNLASLKRKREAEEVNGLSGVNDTAEEREDQHQAQQEPQQQNQQQGPPKTDQQQPRSPAPKYPRKNAETDFPEDEINWDEFPDDNNNQSQNENKNVDQQTFDWPQENKKPASYKQNRKGLSLDQEMAYDAMYPNDWSDMMEEQQQLKPAKNENNKPATEPTKNNAAGWQPQPFPEPPPPKVEPKYQTQTKRIYTPESEKLILQKDGNDLQLHTLVYENGLVIQVLNNIQKSPTRICTGWKPYKENSALWDKTADFLSPLDELLSRGSLTPNTGIVCACKEGTKAEHDQQVVKLKAKQQQYQNQINNFTTQNRQINERLSYWEAMVSVSENILLNKNEYEAYQMKLKAWQGRKSAHDNEQIRQREEYLSQQQKISALQQEPKKQPPPVPPQNQQQNKNPNPPTKPPSPPKTPPGKNLMPVNNPKQPIGRSARKNLIGKIINSHDVKNYAEGVLELQGRFEKFLGHPPANFLMIVHGLPGHGKSMFCFQLAKYLSENFGKVCYIPAEEGVGEATEEKLEMNDAKSDNLDFIPCCNIEDVYGALKKGAYKFIILDSLKRMGITYEEFVEFCDHYDTQAIIAIQQSTKDGQMAGQQSILHEVDIEIIVDDKYAETGKTRSRFSETGRIFDLIPEKKRIYGDGTIAVI